MRLVTVSRLAPNKRVDQAIRAIDLLVKRKIDVSLTVAGTGESEVQLKRLVTDLRLENHVTFAGLVDEAQKSELLQSAHFLLHTSLLEGWGLNVIEANAMGTPAIVYPVDGLIDSTIHGQTGLITQAETPESLVDAVMSIMANQGSYEQLRNGAWKRSHEHQWPSVLPQVCDWLEAKASGKK